MRRFVDVYYIQQLSFRLCGKNQTYFLAVKAAGVFQPVGLPTGWFPSRSVYLPTHTSFLDVDSFACHWREALGRQREEEKSF